MALEQTKTSVCIYDFKFQRKTALIIGTTLLHLQSHIYKYLGNERTGVPANILELVDNVVEIPGIL